MCVENRGLPPAGLSPGCGAALAGGYKRGGQSPEFLPNPVRVSDKRGVTLNVLLIKVTADNSCRAGDKDNKHPLFEADGNLERARQYSESDPGFFFNGQNEKPRCWRARELRPMETPKAPLPAQSGRSRRAAALRPPAKGTGVSK